MVHAQRVQAEAAPTCDARAIEGRYSGQLPGDDGQEAEKIGLVVTAQGQEKYAATFYYGGLPEERARPPTPRDTVALTGHCRDFTLVLTGAIPVRLQYIHGRFTALDDADDYRGHLTQVIR
jgi:hypothetical protein